MFNTTDWSSFVWPVIFVFGAFSMRRYAIGEGKPIPFPLTCLLVVCALGTLALSTDPLPDYQKECSECIEHYKRVKANTLQLSNTFAALAFGSFLGWVALKAKNRKEFFNFTLKV